MERRYTVYLCNHCITGNKPSLLLLLIWSDGGPPYNEKEREKWVTDWGATPKKTTVYHPPANGMVERFNRNLKKVIHAAYPKKKC